MRKLYRVDEFDLKFLFVFWQNLGGNHLTQSCIVRLSTGWSVLA